MVVLKRLFVINDLGIQTITQLLIKNKHLCQEGLTKLRTKKNNQKIIYKIKVFTMVTVFQNIFKLKLLFFHCIIYGDQVSFTTFTR